jgi:tetratricopeptide (TPR) repeat protein
MVDIKDSLKGFIGKGSRSDYRAGIQALLDSKLTTALECFERALEKDPNYVEAMSGIGRVLIKQGRFEESIAWFDRALAIKADSTEGLFNRGVALVYLGKIEEALVMFNHVLEINPRQGDAWDNKALCYKIMGQQTNAEKCLEISLKLQK